VIPRGTANVRDSCNEITTHLEKFSLTDPPNPRHAHDRDNTVTESATQV